MRILIAQDEEVSRRLLERTLRKWGHWVVAAANGEEAWRIFQSEQFNMVISAWVMPVMNGVELVKRIRAQGHQGYVYIILLTAKTPKEDIVSGIKAGADDLVTTPFDQEELKARLHAGERLVELERNLASRNEQLEDANQLVIQINEKMRRELEAAARIQKALLPKMLPEVPGIQFAWDLRPCDQLAGDILNIFPLDEHHIALYVLDVSNHGVSAALLAVTLSRVLSPLMTQSLLLKQPAGKPRGYRLAAPVEVAEQLNRQFPMDLETGQYFTLLYGVLDVRNRRFRYVQAGHPNPIYVSSLTSTVTVLESEGLPIGFQKEAHYQEHSLELKEGDRLYLYSDGIPEALNEMDEQFGEDRFKCVLNEASRLPLKQSLSLVTDRIIDWCGKAGLKDDISIVGFETEKRS